MTLASTGLLQHFIDGPVIKSDGMLGNFLLQASELPSAGLVIHNFIRLSVEYVAPYFEILTGYSQDDVIKGGIPMMNRVCDPREIAQLASAQASYVHQSKMPDFDPRSFNVHSYTYTLNHQRGFKVPIRAMGVILTFTSLGDLEFGVGFLMNGKAEEDRVVSCQSLLRKIKERHNEIYLHAVREESASPYPLNYLTNMDHITTREREVLGMLAKGKSTEEIGKTLNITGNTVETHRRHLLEKFQAKNSAELIKKASKIFWLE